MDDGSIYPCHKELIVKMHLKPGMEIDEASLREMVSADERLRAKDDAFSFLERGYKTLEEVRRRLSAKGYDEDTIGSVSGLLEEYRLVDDERYAKLYSSEKIKKGGVLKIRHELQAKGIDKETIEDALGSMSPDAEKESCRSQAEKKLALLRKRESDEWKLRGKLYGFLVNKGFSRDTVSAVLRELLSADETDMD
jgi:regulatory protein